jgi:O-antigen/teichoic acid export membrane protein
MKNPIVKAGMHLSLGQAATQASSFVRSIILARLISPADFGIAATLGITIQVIEMLSNVSGDMLLIQAKDGDDEGLQGTAQALRAGRGLGSGLIIFLLASPAAKLFGVPDATWAFRCLGLIPVLRGLLHLDTCRLQRHLRFAPAMLTDVGANWCATLVTIPIAFWMRNYVAMLWALLIQASAATIVSHFLAERRYRWSWDRTWWTRIVAFGWPLTINGVLMFGIFEGDRVVIGSTGRLFHTTGYTMADLGVYSAAFALTMAPTMFIANIASSLLLPLLATAQDRRPEFLDRYTTCWQAVSLAAALVSISFITCGGTIQGAVYGPKYAMAGTLIAWLGMMWAMRIVRVAPTLAAMALGDSKNAMLSNGVRTLSIVGMLAAGASGAPLWWVAISGFGGEVLAVLVSVWRLDRRNEVPAWKCVGPLGLATLSTAVSVLIVKGVGGGTGVRLGSSLGALVLTVTVMLLSFPQLRERVFYALSRSGKENSVTLSPTPVAE